MILVNGVPGDAIAATDRGLAYGDGVFRTCVMRGGRPLHWRRHYARLHGDCAALGISCPDETVLRAELVQAAGCTPESECIAKITVTRGPGQRGYALPSPANPTRIVAISALPHYPPDFAGRGIKVHLCQLRLGFQPALAGIKHLNRLENVLARAEWSDAAIAEGLLLDSEDNVIEGTMSNLFIVERGALATPDLTRCGVAGVTRERVMESAARRGIACEATHIQYKRLLEAEEVLLVNSLIGVWQVRELDGRTWAQGGFAARMRQWLDEEGD
ncbi:MAG TPA: aminodeoxychorismate lyase [Burkholderiales bacterium]|nr:aminodeoxychorismate lyase [Burkholderiales bacterium]